MTKVTDGMRFDVTTTLRRLENAFHDAMGLQKLGLISSDEMHTINDKIAECERIIKDAFEEVDA
tara:strand:- start:2137 stop:2328 length:192 start_codon:yes stop_codon:yes gene_type:complete